MSSDTLYNYFYFQRGSDSPRSLHVGLIQRIQHKQESLANAKVSARQPWYIGRNSLNRRPLRIAQQYQRNLYIVEKYFQCATIPSLTMRVYLHSFSRCCLPKMPTSAKFRENLNLHQFNVIQGRWFWYQSKAHMRVPISDLIVTLVVSCTVSEIRRLSTIAYAGRQSGTRCLMNLEILTVLILLNGSWKQFSLAATSVSSTLEVIFIMRCAI